MKKVRFETPIKTIFKRMDESECQSPRPFVEKQAQAQVPDFYEYKRVLYSSDPVHRYEYGDSSPYPLAKKTVAPTNCVAKSDVLPSKDLNLSILDVHEPRSICKPSFGPVHKRESICLQPNVLSPIENTVSPPNVLQKDNTFFIRRDNLDMYNFNTIPLQQELNKLNLDKENEPFAKKAEIARMTVHNVPSLPLKSQLQEEPIYQNRLLKNSCNCHHCIIPKNILQRSAQSQKLPCNSVAPAKPILRGAKPLHHCQQQLMNCFHCEQYVDQVQQVCSCTQNTPVLPQNAVERKIWAIEQFEQSKKAECMEIEKQTNVAKEKREPTISDLLKIIKLQNEQLQLLQEKVDKFISTSSIQINSQQQQAPIQNYMTEHVALQTIDSEHKISIGVMTSFEMVRTSTVINKEILKQNDNAQIQCNMSQISIKEVVSKQPGNMNFLDGITPVGNPQPDLEVSQSMQENDMLTQNTGNLNEEKTFNELSLYNVQVENAITPQISPEQSLYLDIRDYSDSDSISSDDQSNVGWTYYNKVMTHVNGMLQDSDMPSSASALYRNTRQQCVQMQIDKTNVSVTKRVKFGDDPLGLHQPHLYSAPTDTSLKMSQLAAKYLKTPPAPQRVVRPSTNPVDMSFATRNYMERHKLLRGLPETTRPPPPGEIPRFLDITALKQQPKLL